MARLKSTMNPRSIYNVPQDNLYQISYLPALGRPLEHAKIFNRDHVIHQIHMPSSQRAALDRRNAWSTSPTPTSVGIHAQMSRKESQWKLHALLLLRQYLEHHKLAMQEFLFCFARIPRKKIQRECKVFGFIVCYFHVED